VWGTLLAAALESVIFTLVTGMPFWWAWGQIEVPLGLPALTLPEAMALLFVLSVLGERLRRPAHNPLQSIMRGVLRRDRR